MSNPAETNDLVDSSKVVFFRLLNQKQNTNFKSEDFTLLDPVLDFSDTQRNTRIKLIPLALSGFYGVRKLKYNRINIADFVQFIVYVPFATTVGDVLQSINNRYKISLSPLDTVDTPLIPLNGSDTVFYAKLEVAANNLIFYGEVDLVVNFDLDQTINSPVLFNFDLDVNIPGSPQLLNFDLDEDIPSMQCTATTSSSIPGYAQPGCSIPSQPL
jgi:hypothetical protein